MELKEKEVAEKLILSHSTGVFMSKGSLSYDRAKNLPQAKENAHTIADAQIKMIGKEYLIKGTEGTDLEFWSKVKTEIDIFKF